MRALNSMTIMAASLCGGSVWAQIPEGYEVIEVTHNPDFESGISLNNCGELAFSRRIDQSEALEEIFRYDNGALHRITNDAIRDAFPEISQDGVIAWTHNADGWGYGTVAVLKDGTVTYVAPGTTPAINDLHDLAWIRFNEQGCLQSDADVFFYDGSSITQITQSNRSNQSQAINNAGDIVWTRYDFCPYPAWVSNILLRRGGRTLVVSGATPEPTSPDINEQGIVVWGSDENGLQMYCPEVSPFSEHRPRPWGIVTLTEWGLGPHLNNHGDISFLRWHDDNSTWQVWLYRNGWFYQLTTDPFWNGGSDINDWGEVAIVSGNFPNTNIGFMRRIRTGEADFDGDIDLDDAAALHDCLTGPGDFDRLCDCRFLDLDHDRDVDLGDFARFQRAYTGP